MRLIELKYRYGLLEIKYEHLKIWSGNTMAQCQFNFPIDPSAGSFNLGAQASKIIILENIPLYGTPYLSLIRIKKFYYIIINFNVKCFVSLLV